MSALVIAVLALVLVTASVIAGIAELVIGLVRDVRNRRVDRAALRRQVDAARRNEFVTGRVGKPDPSRPQH